MTKEFIEIHWTSGTLHEAQEVSRILVKGKHVACAQITPAVESVEKTSPNIRAIITIVVTPTIIHNPIDPILSFFLISFQAIQ